MKPGNRWKWISPIRESYTESVPEAYAEALLLDVTVMPLYLCVRIQVEAAWKVVMLHPRRVEKYPSKQLHFIKQVHGAHRKRIIKPLFQNFFLLREAGSNNTFLLLVSCVPPLSEGSLPAIRSLGMADHEPFLLPNKNCPFLVPPALIQYKRLKFLDIYFRRISNSENFK